MVRRRGRRVPPFFLLQLCVNRCETIAKGLADDPFARTLILRQRGHADMFLFGEELLALDDIRSELDGAVELEAICALANGFLGCSPPRLSHAELCDEALRHALVHAPTRLRSEISERLAHVEEGPRRTVASLAEDAAPAVAVPVLRYSSFTAELVRMLKRWAADP